ncbi:MAG: hypothetical protein P8L37_06455 [Phycisphaerales bacterium]|nr:hypothetical protein [Phycisphaerales bacterium]
MTSTSETKYTVQIDDGSTFGPASVDELKAWAQEGRVSDTTMLIPDDGSSPVSAHAFQPLQGLLGSEDKVISTIIPWRNKCALIGYYLGILGLLPLVGVPLGLTAIVLGILGIIHWKKNHRSHGLVHSIIAIACGLLGILITGVLLLLPILLRTAATAGPGLLP